MKFSLGSNSSRMECSPLGTRVNVIISLYCRFVVRLVSYSDLIVSNLFQSLQGVKNARHYVTRQELYKFKVHREAIYIDGGGG